MVERRSLSTRERVRLFHLHGGVCHICETKIDGSREGWEIEHVISLAMGGEDADRNMKPAHWKCHKKKTAEVDAPRLAQAKRREARHIGAKAPSRTPLPGGKDSEWKRSFKHGWVRRDSGDAT